MMATYPREVPRGQKKCCELEKLKYLIQFDLMISSINCIESGDIEVNQKVVDTGK